MEGIVKERSSKMLPVSWLMLCAASTVLSVSLPLCAESVSLQALVTPSTTIVKDGRPVTFALHGFIEFKSLAELFQYIESQTQRWNVSGGAGEVEAFAELLELASPSIPGRVLSNWYPIEEGLQLYGATYDSTEHFWQAVKYHPDVTVADLTELLGILEQKIWGPWLARLDDDRKIYLPY